MKTVLKNWRKFIWIPLVSWGSAFGLHTLIPFQMLDYLPKSIIVQNNLVRPVAAVALLSTHAIIVAIFVSFQERLPGTKLAKGIGYGLLVSGIWLISFTESVVVLNSVLAVEVHNWLLDDLPLMLMSVCLGLFVATDSAPIIEKDIRQRIWPALIVAFGLLGGRYFAYGVLGINTPYDPQPWPVLIWTTGLSLMSGVTYLILGRAAPAQSPFRRAIWFGGVIFGINWLLVGMFLPIFYQAPVLNLIARYSIDIFFVTLSVFIAESVLAGSYRTSSEMLEQV
jgi:hypothetical protein